MVQRWQSDFESKIMKPARKVLSVTHKFYNGAIRSIDNLEPSIILNTPFAADFLKAILTVLKLQNAPFRSDFSIFTTNKIIRKKVNLRICFNAYDCQRISFGIGNLRWPRRDKSDLWFLDNLGLSLHLRPLQQQSPILNFVNLFPNTHQREFSM